VAIEAKKKKIVYLLTSVENLYVKVSLNLINPFYLNQFKKSEKQFPKRIKQ